MKLFPVQNYDVAIVTLNDTVEGLAFVKLAPENAPPYVGKKATVMGWGRTTSEPGPSKAQFLIDCLFSSFEYNGKIECHY